MIGIRTFVCRRAGFTLVELLVVIAIIGILVALLLPAIQAAREAARRTQCSNHLKQVALAVTNYETTERVYPLSHLSGSGHATWLVLVMPYIEQGNYYDALDPASQYWSRSDDVLQTQVPSFFCPSRRSSGLSVSGDFRSGCSGGEQHRAGALGDYALNGGDHQAATRFWNPGGNSGIALFNPDVQLEGTCPNTKMIRWKGKRAVRHITDGLSNTLLCGEKYVHPDYQGHKQYGDHCYFNDDTPDSYVRRAGALNESDGHNYGIVGSPAFSNDVGVIARHSNNFGSSHAGGVCQFALCDGSVMSLLNDVDGRMLGRLANIKDGEVISGIR